MAVLSTTCELTGTDGLIGQKAHRMGQLAHARSVAVKKCEQDFVFRTEGRKGRASHIVFGRHVAVDVEDALSTQRRATRVNDEPHREHWKNGGDTIDSGKTSEQAKRQLYIYGLPTKTNKGPHEMP
eukprot:scaffold82997_cov15-Prasinocladus_malaysianus.AAC.1